MGIALAGSSPAGVETLKFYKFETSIFEGIVYKQGYVYTGSVLLAQLVRAWVLWAQGRGFEPHMEHLELYNSLVRLAQLVERKTFNLVVVGSSPTEGID